MQQIAFLCGSNEKLLLKHSRHRNRGRLPCCPVWNHLLGSYHISLLCCSPTGLPSISALHWLKPLDPALHDLQLTALPQRLVLFPIKNKTRQIIKKHCYWMMFGLVSLHSSTNSDRKSYILIKLSSFLFIQRHYNATTDAKRKEKH